MWKVTQIERVVKSSRRGMDRSMAAQIEAQDGGGAVHKKRNGDAVQKKRGGLRSSGRRLREKRQHHKDFYDLQLLGEKSSGCGHAKERRGPNSIQEDETWLAKQSAD